MVGINPTRRGAELARDITHTQCQLVVTDSGYRSLLQGLELGIQENRLLDTDSGSYAEALRPYRGAPLPEVEPEAVEEVDDGDGEIIRSAPPSEQALAESDDS